MLEKGYEVRALVRWGNDCRNLHRFPLELAYGDLTDEVSLMAALKNCHALFHVGALYRPWMRDTALFYQTNVEGTRNLMFAALTAGVERVVYTSSVANEYTPFDRYLNFGHYKQSKYLAELEVLKLVRNRSLPAVIVNHTAPVGPRDIKPAPTGRLIRDAALGKIPAYVNTGLNIVHVDDVPEGHIQALELGVIGEKSILGERI